MWFTGDITFKFNFIGIEYRDFNFEPRKKITAIYMNHGRHHVCLNNRQTDRQDVARDEYLMLLMTTKNKEGIVILSQEIQYTDLKKNPQNDRRPSYLVPALSRCVFKKNSIGLDCSIWPVQYHRSFGHCGEMWPRRGTSIIYGWTGSLKRAAGGGGIRWILTVVFEQNLLYLSPNR